MTLDEMATVIVSATSNSGVLAKTKEVERGDIATGPSGSSTDPCLPKLLTQARSLLLASVLVQTAIGCVVQGAVEDSTGVGSGSWWVGLDGACKATPLSAQDTLPSTVQVHEWLPYLSYYTTIRRH